MKKLNLLLSVITLIVFSTLQSCKKGDADPAPAPLNAVTVSDVAADPATTYDPKTGAPSGYKNKFTFFSFSTGAIVANTDSATSKWDIGFNRTTIIFNSGTSGPGAAGAILQTAAFEDVTAAPATGYKTDNEPGAAKYFASQSPDANFAIPTGSDAAWYHYDATAHTITPIAGRIFVIRTADGKFAKFEILSFYKGAPETPDAFKDLDSYYTFRYSYQASGTSLR